MPHRHRANKKIHQKNANVEGLKIKCTKPQGATRRSLEDIEVSRRINNANKLVSKRNKGKSNASLKKKKADTTRKTICDTHERQCSFLHRYQKFTYFDENTKTI